MSLINGIKQDVIAVTDRGLAYGDGLFETIAFINGQLHLWPRHWQRLQEGGKRLGLSIPEETLLLSWIEQALSEQACPSPAVVKIILSRGIGGRGYRCPEQVETHTIITIHPWPEHSNSDYQQGIKAMICQTALAAQPRLAGIKHLNRLEQVLAAQELTANHCREGIMLEYSVPDGDCQTGSQISSQISSQILVEGVSSNLFFVNCGQLYTPEIIYSGVNGTMRNEVISRAQSIGVKLNIGRFTLSKLMNADEVFFTNSIFGILPVRQIIYPYSKCKPVDYFQTKQKPAITMQLAESLNQALQRPCQFNNL